MKVLSPEQELLAEYLTAIRMPLVSRLLVICELWEPEATMEMLQYIANTEEQDVEKLCSVATEIGRKWKQYDSLLDEPEDPMQILFDELAEHGLSWDDQVLVTAGISDPMAILDFAEWLADHRDATKQEMIAEGNRLIKKYQIDI
jgi:hypothetical protein